MEWSGAEGGVVLEYGTGCTTSIFFVLHIFLLTVLYTM